MNDPIKDIKEAIKQIEREPILKPTTTVHHPKCEVFLGRYCNCGGWLFPI